MLTLTNGLEVLDPVDLHRRLLELHSAIRISIKEPTIGWFKLSRTNMPVISPDNLSSHMNARMVLWIENGGDLHDCEGVVHVRGTKHSAASVSFFVIS
jgi:hypothetical protein